MAKLLSGKFTLHMHIYIVNEYYISVIKFASFIAENVEINKLNILNA